MLFIRLFSVIRQHLSLALIITMLSVSGAYPGYSRPSDLAGETVSVDFTQLHQFARMASDTYLSESAIRDRHPGVSWIATPGHTNVLYFVRTDRRLGIQTVAVRGTVDDLNWQLDMDTHGAFDRKAGVLVHRGFDTVARVIYSDLKGRLNSTFRTYFIGHSLGGAVAAILATYFDREGFAIGGVYTFGQPKFTNSEGVRRYRHLPVLRVVYQNDVVSMLPDAVKGGNARFAHLGPEVVLLSGPYFAYLDELEAAEKSIGAFSQGASFASLPDHKMKWYLYGLREKLKRSQPVSYKQRQRYVVRHKLGSGTDTGPAKKVTNFNRRATY